MFSFLSFSQTSNLREEKLLGTMRCTQLLNAVNSKKKERKKGKEREREREGRFLPFRDPSKDVV